MVWRDDYLMRHIEGVAAAIARVTHRNQRADLTAATDATDEAWRALVDAPRALIYAVDARTLARLLGEPTKLRAAAQLFYAEGRALTAAGDAPTAAQRYARALALLREAGATAPSADDAALIAALIALVPAEAVDPR